MVDHDLCLDANRMVMAFDVMPELLARTLDVELRVAFHCLDELVVAADRRVTRQDVKDESFLDRLLHRVGMERAVLSVTAFLERQAEYLECLVLRCGRESEVARVR